MLRGMSVPLIAAGGGVQIAGFGLAFWQSVVTRREQSPDEQSLADWTRAWIRARAREAATSLRLKTERLLQRLHLRGPRTVSADITVTTGAAASVQGHKSINNRDRPLSERVERLEGEVNDLHRKHSDHRADVNRRIDELSRGVADREAARESERARQLGRRLRYEELGLVVFVGGIGLTTWGALA
jgi:hypothetical protein